MKNRKAEQTLEQQYKKIFKTKPIAATLDVDDLNLEQPYLGRIVDSITTYDVSDNLDSVQEHV